MRSTIAAYGTLPVESLPEGTPNHRFPILEEKEQGKEHEKEIHHQQKGVLQQFADLIEKEMGQERRGRKKPLFQESGVNNTLPLTRWRSPPITGHVPNCSGSLWSAPLEIHSRMVCSAVLASRASTPPSSKSESPREPEPRE